MESVDWSGKRIIIIGGGTAGTATALELRKLNKEVHITILEQSKYTDYSQCALPYVVGREIYAPERIFLLTPEDYLERGINLMRRVVVEKITPEAKTVSVLEEDRTVELKYDFLVIATGALSNIPGIPGLEDTKYFTLKTVDDAKELMEDRGRKAIIIGGGLTGIELAGVLSKAKQVTVLESQHILHGVFDRDMADRLAKALEPLGLIIKENAAIDKVEEGKIFMSREILKFDTLILATGVRPNIALAKQAGLKTGNAVIVDENMKTSDRNIYACGDAAYSVDGFSGAETECMLGSTAMHQARIVAANILSAEGKEGGQKRNMPHVFRVVVSKVKDTVLGSAGLTEEEAEKRGIKTVSATITGTSKAEYFPFTKPLTLKIVADREGKLLGVQAFGQEETAGRINTIALGLQKGATVEDICSLGAAYNPAVSPEHDPLVMAAELIRKKLGLLPKHTDEKKRKGLFGFGRRK